MSMSLKTEGQDPSDDDDDDDDDDYDDDDEWYTDTYKYSSATIQIMMSDASYLQMLQDVPSRQLLALLKRVPKQKIHAKLESL